MVLRLVQTCGACPEQYDVYSGVVQVGYLRLRHGSFRVDCPECGGETVYVAYPNGDGWFMDDERDGYLRQAVAAIEAWQRNDGTAPAAPNEVQYEIGHAPDQAAASSPQV